MHGDILLAHGPPVKQALPVLSSHRSAFLSFHLYSTWQRRMADDRRRRAARCVKPIDETLFCSVNESQVNEKLRFNTAGCRITTFSVLLRQRMRIFLVFVSRFFDPAPVNP